MPNDCLNKDGRRGANGEDAPLERLLAALPDSVRRGYERLRRPGLVWVRVPLGVLLICGGVFAFLPILGLWMLPLGLLLLSEDVPFLRRPTMRGLATVQGWWDRWRS